MSTTTPSTTSALTRPCRTRRGTTRSRWAAIGAAIAVTLGAGGLHLADAADGPTSNFVPITPTRILDTRTGLGLDGPLTSPTPRDLRITGPIATPDGTRTVIPTGATSVVLNVTAVQPTANGFISIRPADAPGTPTTSNLNVTTGQIIPNAVTVAVPTSGDAAGTIELTYDAFGTPGPTTHLLIDVVGHHLPTTTSNTGTGLTTNDVYTRTQADQRFPTRTELTTALDTKINRTDTYTRTQADQRFLTTADLTTGAIAIPGSALRSPGTGDLLIGADGCVEMPEFGERRMFLPITLPVGVVITDVVVHTSRPSSSSLGTNVQLVTTVLDDDGSDVQRTLTGLFASPPGVALSDLGEIAEHEPAGPGVRFQLLVERPATSDVHHFCGATVSYANPE